MAAVDWWCSKILQGTGLRGPQPPQQVATMGSVSKLQGGDTVGCRGLAGVTAGAESERPGLHGQRSNRDSFAAKRA